jgi:hypothetical protein
MYYIRRYHMDVSQITDIQALKALAYDQIVLQEQIQRNLALITARIAEVEAHQADSSMLKTSKAK